MNEVLKKVIMLSSKVKNNKISAIVAITALCVLFVSKSYADVTTAPQLISPVDTKNLEPKSLPPITTPGSSAQSSTQLPVNSTVIDIISDKLQYHQEQNVYVATGNAEVDIKEKNARLTASKITFDPQNNVVIAEDNVKIYKEGKVINGSFVRIKLDEENMFIENPTTTVNEVVISSRNADVFDKRIVSQKGSIKLTDQDIRLSMSDSAGIKAQQVPSLGTNAFKTGKAPSFKLYSKRINVKTSKDQTITIIKDTKVKVGKVTLFNLPYFEVDNNKKDEQVETSLPEFGTTPSLGSYLAAGPIFHLPGGGTFKLAPAIAFGNKLGVGIKGRVIAHGNKTEFGYTTTKKKFMIQGKQQLTKNTDFNYGSYSYIDNGFYGARRPKGIAEIVHSKDVFTNDKFIIGLRTSAGYVSDLRYSSTPANTPQSIYSQNLSKKSYSTAKLQLQSTIEGNQPLLKLGGEYFQLRPIGQFAVSAYGSGDTFQVARLGPQVSSKLGPLRLNGYYFMTGYRGQTPFNFDRYYEGHNNIRIDGTLKVCRYLDIGVYKSYNLDSNYKGNKTVEDRYTLKFGPDDMKFMIGYDSRRKTSVFGLEMLLGSDKTNINYDKLNLVQTDKK
ncbi:MAG: hypothetical protein WCK67_08200 [bacterium]